MNWILTVNCLGLPSHWAYAVFLSSFYKKQSHLTIRCNKSTEAYWRLWQEHSHDRYCSDHSSCSLQPLFFLSSLTTFSPNQLSSTSKQICPHAHCSLLEPDTRPRPPPSQVKERNQTPDRMLLLTLLQCVLRNKG